MMLAGHALEFAGGVPDGVGWSVARALLDQGRAWRKFQAICDAQGGMREPPCARFTHPVEAVRAGPVVAIDNRRLARIAKLAGAPDAPAAGLELHAPVGRELSAGEPLFTLHAETPGELAYALAYAGANPDVIELGEPSGVPA